MKDGTPCLIEGYNISVCIDGICKVGFVRLNFKVNEECHKAVVQMDLSRQGLHWKLKTHFTKTHFIYKPPTKLTYESHGVEVDTTSEMPMHPGFKWTKKALHYNFFWPSLGISKS